LQKKYFERIEYTWDLFLPFREYPVGKIFATFLMRNEQWEKKQWEMKQTGYFCNFLPCTSTSIVICRMAWVKLPFNYPPIIQNLSGRIIPN
jgi:hypothetical protein